MSPTKITAPTPPRTPILWGGLSILIALALVAGWSWQQGAERRALVRLPGAERAAVLRHELESLTALCRPEAPSDDLRTRCQERARFVLEFPECDGPCQQLARRQLPPEMPR